MKEEERFASKIGGKMKTRTRERINLVFIFLSMILLFFLVSYMIQIRLDRAEEFIGEGYIGIIVYVLILIISIVFAPISAIPLVPIASNLWGWFPTAIFSIIGWFIGAAIAFELSRRYGKPFIKRLVSLKEINKLEKMIPCRNIFIGLVLLRIILPVDIFSYALGLFSQINRKTFYSATIIGIIPSAIFLAYLGLLSISYQIIGFAAAIIVLMILFILLGKRNNKICREESRS